MRRHYRYHLIALIAGIGLMAPQANATFRFYYAYGDQMTVDLQHQIINGVAANPGATLNGEIPDGTTIAMNPFGGEPIRLQIWAENTGGNLYVNALSTFTAFSHGALEPGHIYRWGGASADVGTPEDAAPYLRQVTFGGNNIRDAINFEGSINTDMPLWDWREDHWVDLNMRGGFTEFQDYSIMAGNSGSPNGGLAVGIEYGAGIPVDYYIRFATGTRTRLHDLLLGAGPDNVNGTTNGDNGAEDGLKLLANSNSRHYETLLFGGMDQAGAYVDTSGWGVSHSLVTPVPEPASLLVLAIGSAAILRRRTV